MGKPFRSELARLSETYGWAMEQDVSSLVNFLRVSSRDPVCFLGSGGSFSSASFGAHLHEQMTGQVGEALTPLQFCAQSEFTSTSVFMLSAGGKNRDILSAFRNAVLRDTKRIGLICFDPRSPLSALASRVWSTELLATEPPGGRDGFLATNSLIAFFVLIARAYREAGFLRIALPETAQEALDSSSWSQQHLTQALSRRYLLILFGPHTRAAAVDLESKFSEAALGSVQMVDYRNFAHGRHHWIAKHSEETGLVAFLSDDVKDVAERTLLALGSRIPIGRIELHCSPIMANLPALFGTFEVTRLAGVMRGIDPGRPGVPEFGRRIYHLRSTKSSAPIGSSPSLRLVARRKLGTAASISVPLALRKTQESARTFRESIVRESYGAVVFDFDGTLCSSRERFSELRKEISTAVETLLRKHVFIGIATGRGKSVRVQMQQSIKPTLWERVWIGYYNGSQMGRLSDDGFPTVKSAVDPVLQKIDKLVRSDTLLCQVSTITTRPMQITLEAKGPGFTSKDLWRHAVRYLAGTNGVKILFSTHSVDIVPSSVSKLTVLQKMESLISGRDKVLCIGDLGEFPGNDFELLSHPYSLSCDEVSGDENSCWNFAPAGFHGAQAAMYYVSRMRITRERFTLSIPPLVDKEG